MQISLSIDGFSSFHYNSIIMQRKVIRVGTSAAVLIPKAVMDERNLQIGDTIDLDFSGTSSNSIVDPALIEWTDAFIKKNRGLLDKLANA